MNTNFTKNPIVGTPLTPSVIKQIHTAVRRYMPIAGNGIRTSVTAGGTIISAIPAPAPKKQKDKPLPFEVRYDGTLDSGSGAWVIWLPDITKLVMYDKSYITPSGVTAATELVAGWYTINDVAASDTAVWINLHIPDSDSGSSVTASFSNSADTATTGESVAAILVAQMSTDATEGYKLVKQFVDSAILLGGGSDGGGGLSGTVEFVADINWYVNGSIHQIIKRLRVLNLATGVVTDKAGTTYNNGWEVAANTTPISSIIGG